MNTWQEQLDSNIWLVGVAGRLDHNLTPALEEQFDDLFDRDRHRVIVDMSAVTYINSGGLRSLVSAWRRAKRAGGNVFLIGLNSRVDEIFKMVGFDKVFDIYPDAATAKAQWQRHED